MERRTIIILFIVSLSAAVLFAGAIRLAGPLLARFPHLPDQGPAWYFWKLPEATTAARISAWVLYGLHQLLTWLFVRMVLRSREQKASRTVRLTVIALLGNLAFIVFLFIQLSFAAAFIYRQVPWITLLEVFVAAHGTMVALLNAERFGSSAIWPMFLFGFLLVFVVTQLFGLKPPTAVRLLAIGLYAAAVAVVYYFRGYERLYELTFIPLTLYAGAVMLPWFVALGQKLVGLAGGGRSSGGRERDKRWSGKAWSLRGARGESGSRWRTSFSRRAAG